MLDYDHPAQVLEYRGYTIIVYPWGKSGKFYGELDNGNVHQSGAAQGLYDTPEDAVAACKDLIDFPYGHDDE